MFFKYLQNTATNTMSWIKKIELNVLVHSGSTEFLFDRFDNVGLIFGINGMCLLNFTNNKIIESAISIFLFFAKITGILHTHAHIHPHALLVCSFFRQFIDATVVVSNIIRTIASMTMAFSVNLIICTRCGGSSIGSDCDGSQDRPTTCSSLLSLCNERRYGNFIVSCWNRCNIVANERGSRNYVTRRPYAILSHVFELMEKYIG